MINISEEYARSVVENWNRLDLEDITVGPRQCFETIVELYEQIEERDAYLKAAHNTIKAYEGFLDRHGISRVTGSL